MTYIPTRLWDDSTLDNSYKRIIHRVTSDYGFGLYEYKHYTNVDNWNLVSNGCNPVYGENEGALYSTTGSTDSHFLAFERLTSIDTNKKFGLYAKIHLPTSFNSPDKLDYAKLGLAQDIGTTNVHLEFGVHSTVNINYFVATGSGATELALISTVPIDTEVHDLLLFHDKKRWYFSVDGESPVIQAYQNTERTLYPWLGVVNGLNPQQEILVRQMAVQGFGVFWEV